MGILGVAKIAGEFLTGAKDFPRVRIDAVSSRDAGRARAFADEHGIARAHVGYEAMIADPELDALYIPLPNALHAPWAEAALRAGKHVLCEKPLTGSAATARALFALAERRQRVLLEAFPYRFQPYFQEILRLVHGGEIGVVRQLQATFGITLREGPNVRLHPELEGGALFDVGCYAVNALRALVGRAPRQVCAIANWDPSGVDRELSAMLDYGDGVQGQIACSFDHAPHRALRVFGTQGVIESTYPNTPDPTRPFEINIRRGTAWRMDFDRIELPAPPHGFRCETEAFVDLIEGRRADRAALDRESIDNAATLRALLDAARQPRWTALGDD
jgi:predicted dehydrogenase